MILQLTRVTYISTRAGKAASKTEGARFVHVEPNPVEFENLRQISKAFGPPFLGLFCEPIWKGSRSWPHLQKII